MHSMGRIGRHVISVTIRCLFVAGYLFHSLGAGSSGSGIRLQEFKAGSIHMSRGYEASQARPTPRYQYTSITCMMGGHIQPQTLRLYSSTLRTTFGLSLCTSTIAEGAYRVHHLIMKRYKGEVPSHRAHAPPERPPRSYPYPTRFYHPRMRYFWIHDCEILIYRPSRTRTVLAAPGEASYYTGID